MINPELVIIVLNVIIIFIAYFVVYPRFCGANEQKIIRNDLIATAVVLIVSGCLVWGQGVEFSLLLFSTNWFWFTLITYFIIELPVMIWYYKKHRVWPSDNN